MGYIRLAWTLFFVIIVFLISVPFLLVGLIIGLFSMKARDKYTMVVVRATFGVFLWAAGTKVHISGAENLKKYPTVVYIGNHRSFFDVLVSYTLFPSITSFVAKKEFEKVPFLSWWMKMLHNLFLDRGDIKQGLKTTLTAIEYAKSGISICIFPEGTRNKTTEPILEFHPGSFKIAEKSGCPIIPMTMYNMSAVFEDHFPKITKEHVFIDFGEPIIIKELEADDKKHISDYVRNKMLNTYDELRNRYEEFNTK